MTNDSIATLDPIINFKDYSRLIFIYPRIDDFTWSGKGFLGKSELSSSGDGTFTASIVWLSTDYFETITTTAHELGHNFGFLHASSIASDGPYFIPESLLNPTNIHSTTHSEYGDWDDMMGGCVSCTGHFSTIWKSQAQWIDSSQIQEATTSGEYTIDQVELSSTGTKVLKIPLGKDVDDKDFHYWVEYRKNPGPFNYNFVGKDKIHVRTNPPVFAFLCGRYGCNYGWSYNSIIFYEQPNVINLTPVKVSISDIIATSAGTGHSLALKSDGTVWAWGYNYPGQLGNGTTKSSRTPVQVSGLTTITAIAAGGDYSLALNADDTVWAWGGYLGLGNGSRSDSTIPVKVIGLEDVRAIDAGWYHSLALKTDGTVWAWGNNYYGQFGNGTTTADGDSSVSLQMSGLTNITDISCGAFHSLALKSDGTVWSCGYNKYGQLGNGTTIDSLVPVQVSGLNDIRVVAISCGAYHNFARSADGTVWAWGDNYSGQLGDGTTINRSVPVQLSSLSGITAIDGGVSTSIALRSDGTVWTWGDHEYGLGDGITTRSADPVQASGLDDIYTISSSMSGDQFKALDSDNKVWEWGGYRIKGEEDDEFMDIDIDKLFYDPYRGVRIKLIEKTGSGTESKARLKVALSGFHIEPADVLNFGDVYINSQSIQAATVTNNSGGEIEIGNISISGRNSELFTITADGCSNKTLQNGESCNVTISFSPDSAGDKFGILSVPNNDTIRPKATISLYGYGSTEVTSTPTPTVTPTPTPSVTQKPTVLPTPISCDDSYEPNDSEGKAYGPLSPGSSYDGKICLNSDVDWYKVNITSAGTISLSLSVPSSNDFDLELYDSSDTLIASSNSATGADESIHYNVTTTGDYYIKVYEFYGSYNSTTPYTLAYSFTNCEIESIGVFPGTVKLKRESSKDITMTVTGTNGCQVEGTKVTAKITVGKDRISISPISQSADEDGKATFTVTAGNTSGRARIMFVAGDKKKILAVKIK